MGGFSPDTLTANWLHIEGGEEGGGSVSIRSQGRAALWGGGGGGVRANTSSPRAELFRTKSAGFQVARDHWQRLRRAPPPLAFVAPGVPLK